MDSTRSERLYRFEPLDTSGVFLGLGVVQCGLLGVGLISGAVALTAGAPVVLALLPPSGGAFVGFARIGGHAAWEWLPLGAAWVWMRIGRGARWLPRLPLVVTEPADLPLPPCLAGLSIVEVPWRGRLTLAAVRDVERDSLTAVVPVSGLQFLVAPRPEQERLLACWGDVLNQFAVERGSVTHVSWSDLARPSGMAEHLAWLGYPDRAESDSAASSSYRELLDGAAASATTHEVLVTITVSAERLGRRRASRSQRDAHLCRSIVSSTEALLRGLRSAGLDAADPLGAVALRRAVRTRIEPHAVRARRVDGRLVDRLALVSAPGPLALEAAWRHVHVDGCFHRTYWVACWPRLGMPPSWLEPFLSGSGVTRSMTVVFCPVPTRQSRRRIERHLVKLESDAVTKEDKGRRVDARQRRATDALLEREEELVSGYAEMAYVGLVTVSASTEEELDEHGEIVEQLARESGMELRCLDGRQDLAWAAALPIGLAPKALVA